MKDSHPLVAMFGSFMLGVAVDDAIKSYRYPVSVPSVKEEWERKQPVTITATSTTKESP